MRKLAATTMGLGLLVSTAQATPAARYAVTQSGDLSVGASVEFMNGTYHVGDNAQIQVNVDARKGADCAPVTGYSVKIVASPAGTMADVSDDIVLKTIAATPTTPQLICGIEHDYGTSVPLEGLSPGNWIVYTQGQISGITLRKDLVSYDTITMLPGAAPAPVPSLFVPDKSDVDEWSITPLVVTAGGIIEPRWHDLRTLTSLDIMQYEAGKNLGAHFAVLGTKGYVEGIKVETDPCKPAEPCVAPLREELYIVGATLDGQIINTEDITNNRVTSIQPGQELVARYASTENVNMRTHIIASLQNRDPRSGYISLDQRLAGHTILPSMQNVFAIEAVLYGIVGIDADGDGKIMPSEQHCEPIAWKTQYVQVVPKGHEGAAFLGGVVVGLAGGYLLSAYGGPESNGHGPLSFPEFPLGTYTSDRQGNIVE